MNDVIRALVARRSVRAYKPDPIDEASMRSIVEAGQYAPSAMGRQPWHFTVIRDAALLNRCNALVRDSMLNSGNERLKGWAMAPGFHSFYDAPAVVLVSADAAGIAPEEDCALAMQNLFIAAHSLGIGSVWINAFMAAINAPEAVAFCEELKIPVGYRVYSAAAFGYADGEVAAPDARKAGASTFL